MSVITDSSLAEILVLFNHFLATSYRTLKKAAFMLMSVLDFVLSYKVITFNCDNMLSCYNKCHVSSTRKYVVHWQLKFGSQLQNL